jgi:hypothetical protein
VRTIGFAAVIVLCLLGGIASAETWQLVPLPAGAGYARSLAAGSVWLYAGFNTPQGVSLGLYRTPIVLPGSWESIPAAGTDVRDVRVGGPGDQYVWVAGAGDVIRRSTDGGAHWSLPSTPPPGATGTSVAWDEIVPGRVYVSSRSENSEWISVSTDLGDSWVPIGGGEMINSPRLLQTRAGVGETVYEAWEDGYWETEAKRSTNGGETWNTASVGVPYVTPPTSLEAPPGSMRLYCLSGGNLIFRWDGLVPLDLWGVPFYAGGFAVGSDPGPVCLAAGVNGNGHLGAVWRLPEDTAWTDISEGFPADISPSPDGSWWSFHVVAARTAPRFFFSTAALGLWMRDFGPVTAAGESGMRMIEGPYPNPSSGDVFLRIAGEYAATLTIYDAVGRLISTTPSSGGALTWTGRRSDGSPAGAGVYWGVVSRSSGERRTVRIVRIR